MRNNFSGAMSALDMINKILSDDFPFPGVIPFSAPRQVRELQTGGFPHADILVDKDKNYIIKIALAGVPKDKIVLEHQNRVVNLKVNLEEPVAHPEEGPDEEKGTEEYYVQNGIKKFSFVENSWTIPRAWDIEKVSVDYKDGLLTIRIPYSDESRKLEEKKTLLIE